MNADASFELGSSPTIQQFFFCFLSTTKIESESSTGYHHGEEARKISVHEWNLESSKTVTASRRYCIGAQGLTSVQGPRSAPGVHKPLVLNPQKVN